MAIPSSALAAMREVLPEVSRRTIEAVTEEVPGYRGTLDEQASATLTTAVQQALLGFLAVAEQADDPGAPLDPYLQGAYELGRVEARQGRPMDALLAAYRVGARVSWRGLAEAASRAGLAADGLVVFAELTFAYIDRLSAASVAGHADEVASEGRMRARHLERLGHGLVTGAEASTLQAAAERAAWSPPEHLVAVLLPEPRCDDVLARIDARTLQPAEDVPDLPDGMAVLLVPQPEPRLVGALGDGPAVVGPPRPWLQVARSYQRAVRAWRLGLASDGVLHADDVLAQLVAGADPDGLADLRSRALAPLAGLRPATAERLAETLRAWLLHRGRRDEVAAELVVHPQTVRYRMGQVRDLFGDRLDDPTAVLELTIALAIPNAPVRQSAAELMPPP